MTDMAIPTANDPIQAYVCEPSGPGPWPGVVVIHDVLGMSHDLRRQADWLAGAGYLAAAPDLYHGGRKLTCMISTMRDARARRGRTFDYIETVRTWLTARSDCTGRIGLIGYCWAADSRYSSRRTTVSPPPASTTAPPPRTSTPTSS